MTPPGELGFLVPYADCIAEWPQELLSTAHVHARTMLYMPFRKSGEHSSAQAVKKLALQFTNDIKPETVLFLRKLQCIQLHFPGVRGREMFVMFSRTEEPDGVDVVVQQISYYPAKNDSA